MAKSKDDSGKFDKVVTGFKSLQRPTTASSYPIDSKDYPSMRVHAKVTDKEVGKTGKAMIKYKVHSHDQYEGSEPNKSLDITHFKDIE
jgi:hypothetical protein